MTNTLQEKLVQAETPEFSSEQCRAVAEVLENRYSLRDLPDDLSLSQGPGKVVKIELDRPDAPIFADPENEYDINGNRDVGVAPEGATTDGNDEEQYGIR